MATLITEKQLAELNATKSAKIGRQYVVLSTSSEVASIGSLYVGTTVGTTRFITDNFDTKAQGAVGGILENTSSSNAYYNPNIPSIDTSVNQMNLGDVLAFSAAN